MFTFNTIEEALESLRNGEMIIVTDDENRENEGDLICAAEHATTENVNFMAKYGRGLICMPMGRSLVEKLCLPPMVIKKTPTTTKRHSPS
ncbi:3,4-dihydroxy-2-butanone-4-phosphate synthase [uncultured Methanocorpusculum sp.]|nr:3,4-dihydroxy-2-butanone-4-phosphate synthase [uncultured Methanocorpusculum sp.]